MRIKTSITLSEELLKVLDKRARQLKKNRSAMIEVAVWTFLRQLARDDQKAKDLEILNRRASSLNREATDVLAFQIPV